MSFWVDKNERIHSLKYGLKWVSAIYPRITLTRGFIAVFQAILPIIYLYTLKVIIDQVTEGAENLNQIDGIGADLYFWMFIFGFILLIEQLLNPTSEYFSNLHHQKIVDLTQLKLQEKAVKLDISDYENSETLNHIRKVHGESNSRPPQLLSSTFELGKHTLILLTILTLLVSFHWSLLFVVFLSTFPTLLVKAKFSRHFFDWKVANLEAERKASYFHGLFSNLLFIKEEKVYKSGKFIQNKFNHIRSKLFDEKKKILGKILSANFLVKFLESAIIIGILFYFVYSTLLGWITIGAMVMYFQAFQRSRQSTQMVMQHLVILFECSLYFEYFQNFFEKKSALKTPDIVEKTEIKKPITLQLKNVNFTYPNTDRPILKDINLNLEQGKIYAIVGKNGSGKTSLIKLLSRFYDVSSGEISHNGINIQEIDQNEYLSKVSYQLQEVIDYQLSFKEIMQLVDIDRGNNIEELENIGKEIGLNEKFKTFKNGYKNLLGKKFEGSEELSWGQWQKIHFGKSIFKNADIIFLDEPTSALDPYSELMLYKSLERVKKNKIIIILTHRLFNLNKVDEVLVMQEGQIIEQGSHSQLMENKNQYYKMSKMQLV